MAANDVKPRDVRKLARGAEGRDLAMTDSHLRAVVDTAVDGVILMEARGKVTMFNRACEGIFGYSAQEIVGADFKRLTTSLHNGEENPYLLSDERSPMKPFVGGGGRIMGLRKSGETFPLELSVGEVTDGGDIAYVGILRDVSKRANGEEQRELLIEQLAKSNAELTHFVHAASHDLREPMRMITAFCGRLAKDYRERLDARGAEYLSLAVSASERMNLLLDDLVDFARLSNDADRLSTFDSNVVVDRVIEMLSGAVARADAEITHGDLPVITGNAMRFERLMQNLIGNALKYVEPDTRPCVHVDAEIDGEFWRFSVTDNGIGIDPRHFNRIFEPFKRLHARGRFEGTGLGLAICRKIVEGFGGAITVRSSEGQGSTFSFTLPNNVRLSEGVSDDA